ncbi:MULTISPECIES: hypothetical protein [unclassified Roseibium]|uniref:hypothetical protein n=1 Tax=unclassified Roseibium TaxID=2629323 RepID=UPI0027401B61|nr:MULTISPECIES: hypothetical protein [unclassified Roseibium]
MTTKLDWTPVRRGDVYCSPRCGAGCTWKAYQTAVQRADDLAERMGDGWEPRIWENGGWHYSVRKGRMEIHPRHEYSTDHERAISGYWASFVSSIGQFHQDAKDPLEAYGMVMQEFRTKHAIALEEANEVAL